MHVCMNQEVVLWVEDVRMGVKWVNGLTPKSSVNIEYEKGLGISESIYVGIQIIRFTTNIIVSNLIIQ